VQRVIDLAYAAGAADSIACIVVNVLTATCPIGHASPIFLDRRSSGMAQNADERIDGRSTTLGTRADERDKSNRHLAPTRT